MVFAVAHVLLFSFNIAVAYVTPLEKAMSHMKVKAIFRASSTLLRRSVPSLSLVILVIILFMGEYIAVVRLSVCFSLHFAYSLCCFCGSSMFFYLGYGFGVSVPFFGCCGLNSPALRTSAHALRLASPRGTPSEMYFFIKRLLSRFTSGSIPPRGVLSLGVVVLLLCFFAKFCCISPSVLSL